MSASVRPASAIARRLASTVSETGSTISRRPTADWPTPVSATLSSNFETEAGARSAVFTSRGSGTGPGLAAVGTGSNSGRYTSSAFRKVTLTRIPMNTSSGSQPTIFVVSRTPGSSSSATIATTYGGGKAGSHCCQLTVNATTVALPDTAPNAMLRPPQTRHAGSGGCV